MCRAGYKALSDPGRQFPLYTGCIIPFVNHNDRGVIISMPDCPTNALINCTHACVLVEVSSRSLRHSPFMFLGSRALFQSFFFNVPYLRLPDYVVYVRKWKPDDKHASPKLVGEVNTLR